MLKQLALASCKTFFKNGRYNTNKKTPSEDRVFIVLPTWLLTGVVRQLSGILIIN